jgi:hypothetical protein
MDLQGQESTTNIEVKKLSQTFLILHSGQVVGPMNFLSLRNFVAGLTDLKSVMVWSDDLKDWRWIDETDLLSIPLITSETPAPKIVNKVIPRTPLPKFQLDQQRLTARPWDLRILRIHSWNLRQTRGYKASKIAIPFAASAFLFFQLSSWVKERQAWQKIEENAVSMQTVLLAKQLREASNETNDLNASHFEWSLVPLREKNTHIAVLPKFMNGQFRIRFVPKLKTLLDIPNSPSIIGQNLTINDGISAAFTFPVVSEAETGFYEIMVTGAIPGESSKISTYLGNITVEKYEEKIEEKNKIIESELKTVKESLKEIQTSMISQYEALRSPIEASASITEKMKKMKAYLKEWGIFQSTLTSELSTINSRHLKVSPLFKKIIEKFQQQNQKLLLIANGMNLSEMNDDEAKATLERRLNDLDQLRPEMDSSLTILNEFEKNPYSLVELTER